MIQETRDVGAVIKKFDEDNYRQTSKIGSMETFRKTTKLHDCGHHGLIIRRTTDTESETLLGRDPEHSTEQQQLHKQHVPAIWT
jgi:hypothetical protein